MLGMSFVEFLVVLITAIIKVGIPIAVAVWIIQALRCIRADNQAIQSKLEAIEQQLQRGSKS
jgi:hypothetical protein